MELPLNWMGCLECEMIPWSLDLQSFPSLGALRLQGALWSWLKIGQY